MPDPAPPPSQNPPPRRKRRWPRRLLLAFLVLIVFPLLVLTGIFFYNRHRAERALAEAIVETDRLDPGWRLEDMEKLRAQLPDEENAAIVVGSAAAKIPAAWPSRHYAPEDGWLWSDDLKAIRDELPQHQMDPKLAKMLRIAVKPFSDITHLVEKASSTKAGYYPMQKMSDAWLGPATHLMNARNLGEYLRFLAMVQCQEGKQEDAWRTSQWIITVAHAFGDEPVAAAQALRLYLRVEATTMLERCLAQGAVQELALMESQNRLTEESTYPLIIHLIRGERALVSSVFVNLEAGNLDEHFFKQLRIVDKAWLFVTGNTFKDQHAWYLTHMNALMATTTLAPNEQLKKCKSLQFDQFKGPPVARNLVISGQKFVSANIKTLSLLQCSRTAIAVERFRLQNNRWPESLDEVVAAKLLDKVPEDPYDGKPFRYRKTTDGVVVYSIGDKGDYACDALDPGCEFDPDFFRCEFRLWDESHRRQPPRPTAKADGKL